MSQPPSVAKDVGTAVVETGRVFGNGGTDGLILYALLLGTLMMAAILGWVLWLNHRERTRAASDLLTQSTTFSKAADNTAEASKDLATAIASAASADMTFKQTVMPIIAGMEHRIERIEQEIGRNRS